MKAIQVETNGKHKLLIEVDDSPTLLARAQSGGAVAGGAEDTIRKLEDVGATIADVCRTLQQKVRDGLAKAAPQELELEFGVKLTGEIGIPLVTKGSAEGTFNVKAKWTFQA